MDRSCHTISYRLSDRPEIIVIDNNSTDNSLNIVKNFMQDPLLNKKIKELY